MALVIEDGSGVAGANSYITVAEARAYASTRGLSLPVADSEVEQLLISAMDYLESYRDRYQGRKTSPSNPLQWPRVGVVLDGAPWPSDAIPVELKSAQARLAVEAQTQQLFVSSDGREIIKEKVDVIEVQYAEGSVGASGQPYFAAVEALLEPLLRSGGIGGGFLTVRV